MRKQSGKVVSAAVLAAGMLMAGRAMAGNLNPTNAPGPTMHTLEEIYQKVGAFVSPQILSATTTVVNAGYYATTNLTQVDTDLKAENIATNVTIFGIAGTLSTQAGVQYFTIGSEGFAPGGNVDYFNTYGNGGAYIVSGIGALVAPVHLPHGAVVTEFRVYYYDNSAGNLDVSLLKQGFNSAYVNLAEVTSSGTPGYSNGVDTTIYSATINNTNGSYLVNAYSDAWDYNLKIKAAVIVYTGP
jgi:hypothetical protein